MDKQLVLQAIENFPIIPVYYNSDPQTCISIMSAVYAGGIRVFEFTNRGPEAMENFKLLLQERDLHLPGLVLGIGTIKTAEQAISYIQAGADFIVSPIVREDLAGVTKDFDVLWIPGCMTPTEINLAEEFGAPLVKLFPGDTLGPAFLRGIKPLFPGLKFMPTGGVDLEKDNIIRWLDAGVSALGFGSKLFLPPTDAADYSWLTIRCANLMNIVSQNKA